MQSDLPWNIVGIPPEARDTARAAARRDGLSVGEWLTRRILHSSANGNGAPNGIAAREPTLAFDQLAAHLIALRERLARVEQQANSDGPRQAIKALHQGLSRLAGQYSESADQSAKQFGALASNVESVAVKLVAVRSEAESASRGLDERTSGLATSIDAVARKLLEARDETRSISRALDERIVVIAEHMRSVEQAAHASAGAIEKAARDIASAQTERKTDDAENRGRLTQLTDALTSKLADLRDEARSVARGFEERIVAIAERMGAAEQTVHASSAAIEKSAHDIASAQAERKADDAESHGRLAQLTDSLERLVERVDANEAQHAAAVARLEDGLSKNQPGNEEPLVDRRLDTVERTLSDIAARLDASERAGATGAIEESLRDLASRVDAEEKRHVDDVAQLRTLVAEAKSPPSAVELALALHEPLPPQATLPETDLPPLPDIHAEGGDLRYSGPHEAGVLPPPAEEQQPPFLAAAHDDAHIAEPDATGEQAADTAPAESFLAAARRSALAASAGAAEQGARGSFFSWRMPEIADKTAQSSTMRTALIAALVLLVIGAIAAGVILSRGHAPARVGAIASSHSGMSAAARTANMGRARQLAARVQRTGSLPAPAAPVTSAAAKPQPPVTTAQRSDSLSPLDRLAALATSGNGNAELLLGLKYLDGDGIAINEAEAARWLERAANQGEAVAAYRLGTLYERGHGVPADPAKAAQWYSAAAREGNRKAMHNLAIAYAQGAGVQKNMAVAAQWFSHAAALGLADSEFNLGVLYERGMGVPQSLVDAYKWYAIAAAQGDAESKARIDALSTQLNANDKNAAEKAAETFRPQPIEQTANLPPDAATVVGG